jgi:O-antigen/teichoic acid export membrane protein
VKFRRPSPALHDDRPPSLLSRVWRGTFWLALKSPLQVVIAFWSVPLIQQAIGAEANGAYVFAWGFAFLQFLLEFGMSPALQREVTLAWTRGDRDRVNRLIAAGLTFYTVMSLVQVAILLAIAAFGLPPRFQGESRRLVVGLLWVQALAAPFLGWLSVVSSVLQAARRYALLPVSELLTLIARFAVLVVGLRAGVDFLAIIVIQMVIMLCGMLLPALWVIVRELRCFPRFAGLSRAEYAPLLRIGFYTLLMQVSVVLADKVDAMVLGYALPGADVGASITVYQNVSRPFLQIRQTAWTLAYLVMPAVASLSVTRDLRGLDRLKYDGTRLLVGLLLPVALLAGIHAAPFLSLWVGPRYAVDAPLLQLFLVATLPMVFSVWAQMAIGLGKVEVVALSPFVGSLLNLPLSYYLTTRLGVAGVVWGTVLTTLIANLLVPGVYLFHLLEIEPARLLTQTLSAPLAGAALMVPTLGICRALVPLEPAGTGTVERSLPLVLNLAVGMVAYAAGYSAVPAGRTDLAALVRRLRPRH